METKVWKRSVFIPEYLIMSISDSGKEETWVDEEGEVNDDLRIAIVLETGVEILLNEGRMIYSDGGIWLERLIEEPERII